MEEVGQAGASPGPSPWRHSPARRPGATGAAERPHRGGATQTPAPLASLQGKEAAPGNSWLRHLLRSALAPGLAPGPPSLLKKGKGVWERGGAAPNTPDGSSTHSLQGGRAMGGLHAGKKDGAAGGGEHRREPGLCPWSLSRGEQGAETLGRVATPWLPPDCPLMKALELSRGCEAALFQYSN